MPCLLTFILRGNRICFGYRFHINMHNIVNLMNQGRKRTTINRENDVTLQSKSQGSKVQRYRGLNFTQSKLFIDYFRNGFYRLRTRIRIYKSLLVINQWMDMTKRMEDRFFSSKSQKRKQKNQISEFSLSLQYVNHKVNLSDIARNKGRRKKLS